MYVVNGKGSLIQLIVGLFILVSVNLGIFYHPYWFYFTGFVGFMLILSSITGFCPMELILKAVGIEEKVVQDR